MAERILMMGAPGTGKSLQWLRMAEALKPTGTKFRVLDTDAAIPFMLDTQFPALKIENGGNVQVLPSYDWPHYREGLQIVLKDSKPGDWVTVDMIDSAWSTVQSYFVGEVFKKDIGDYFLDIRKRIEEKKTHPRSIMQDAMKGWVDWPVVNKLYDDWILPLVHQEVFNLYATTKAQPVTADDDPGMKLVFGELGVRPSGQKNLGHQVHSCFLLTWDGKDGWNITTAKDRSGRRYFANDPLISFFKQYLVIQAGFKVPIVGAK